MMTIKPTTTTMHPSLAIQLAALLLTKKDPVT